MGIFGLFKKKHNKSEAQVAADRIIASMEQLANSPSPVPISAEEYADIRQREIDWLESHYDFNSLSGIKAIPVIENLPRPAGDSATGDVYYYLKFKAYEHEKAGDAKLAIACFGKSIKLMRLKFGKLYGREESYSYIRMLARNGMIEPATKEKKYADRYYGPDPMYEIDPKKKTRDDAMIEREYNKWLDNQVVLWLQENIPDRAPKNVTSFRRMRTQNTKTYQLLKQYAAEHDKEI